MSKDQYNRDGKKAPETSTEAQDTAKAAAGTTTPEPPAPVPAPPPTPQTGNDRTITVVFVRQHTLTRPGDDGKPSCVTLRPARTEVVRGKHRLLPADRLTLPVKAAERLILMGVAYDEAHPPERGN